jgi:hypothetical protein
LQPRLWVIREAPSKVCTRGRGGRCRPGAVGR